MHAKNVLFRYLQRSTTAWFRRAGTETTRRTPGTETWGDRTEILAKGKSFTLGAMKLCKIMEEFREGYQGQGFHRTQPHLHISLLFFLQIFDEKSGFFLLIKFLMLRIGLTEEQGRVIAGRGDGVLLWVSSDKWWG
jgi:hypothetical protein